MGNWGFITLLRVMTPFIPGWGAPCIVFNRPLTFQFLRTNRNHGFLLIIISSLVQYVHHYIGDGHPTFDRNPYNWYIKPYYWVDEFIPYYMEIMGVDRPIAHMNLNHFKTRWDFPGSYVFFAGGYSPPDV